MRLRLLLLLTLPAAVLASDTKKAGRMLLNSGEVAEVVCTRTPSTATTPSASGTLIVRLSSGSIFTVTTKDDYSRDVSELVIKSGPTTLEIRDQNGYYSDGLPVPFEVKIGKDVYRVLLKPNTLTDDQKRMQAAVAKLPEPFLSGIKQLEPIALHPACTLPGLIAVENLFPDKPAPNGIATITKMTPDEVEALTRDATPK